MNALVRLSLIATAAAALSGCAVLADPARGEAQHKHMAHCKEMMAAQSTSGQPHRCSAAEKPGDKPAAGEHDDHRNHQEKK